MLNGLVKEMKLKDRKTVYYKGAKLNGWDWYTGKTVNYRENVGAVVEVPYVGDNMPQLCSPTVLHASRKPNNIFIGSYIPSSVYVVKGKPVVYDGDKAGFKQLYVEREIPQDELDILFGWRYSEACNPVNSLKINPPSIITEEHIETLHKWDSVGASVWDSVWDSVWASVGENVGASVGDSVGASVGASIRASVWDSVWASVGENVGASVGENVGASVGASVWDSVGASVWAYIGYLFPNIKKWKYVKHKRGVYPFQLAVDLWMQGLVPSFDGDVWRLHGGEKASVLYEEKKRSFKG